MHLPCCPGQLYSCRYRVLLRLCLSKSIEKMSLEYNTIVITYIAMELLLCDLSLIIHSIDIGHHINNSGSHRKCIQQQLYHYMKTNYSSATSSNRLSFLSFFLSLSLFPTHNFCLSQFLLSDLSTVPDLVKS